jgi:hypothetical protein
MLNDENLLISSLDEKWLKFENTTFQKEELQNLISKPPSWGKNWLKLKSFLN